MSAESGIKSILVVEDEPAVVVLLKEILSIRFPGCEVYTGTNGVQGFELYSKFQPDVVISDLDMPKMNGMEMAKRIKTINPNAIIIFTSACPGNIGARRDELDIFLKKPFNLNQLFEIITSL